MVLDYIILGLYALSMIAIAFITKNRSGSVNDFLLAGKKGLNGWMTAFAYGTTYFSAVIFIGYAGQFGRSFGLASIWIGVGNAILGTLIAWLVLAKRTRNMTKRLGAKTMPEFFEKRYGSQGIKLVAAVLIFIFLIPYSASVYNGLSTLFEIVFGIEGWIVMVALAALTALYLCFGGYFATALSDFVQGIIMIVGVVCMIVCFMNHESIQWNISSLTSNPNLTWFTFGNDNSSGLYGTTVSLISLILLTSIGVWGLPQTIHKYYAIRDKKAIKQGIIVSTAFALLIGFVAYFTGALSHYFPETAGLNDAQVIPTMLNIVIPSGLIGLIAVLILSASMSTLSSVSLTSASVVAVDIYKGKINKSAADKKVNLLMRVLCLIFVAISVVIAVLNEKFGIAAIAYMMGISWGTLSGCFMGPFVIGLLWKKVSRPAVWASIISSPILTATLILIFGYDKGNWSCTLGQAIKNGVATSPLIGVICMIFSVIVTVVITLLTKAPDKEIIYNAFDAPIEDEIK
ncbi:MAG: sodium:solute symporter family protein [Ruminococcaceae bacterium]|nr:sodium:solute symporter family protein [Oscillospiraceae bacterium]